VKLVTSRGHEFLISDQDAELVLPHRWHTTSCGYVASNIKQPGGGYKHVRLHRLLMGVTDERDWVDHVNGDPLDNRRENLRICTRLQNAANQRPRRGASSPYRGVTLTHVGRPKPWRATVRGRIVGHFPTQEAAAFAYDKAAKETYGDFAYQNFAEGVFG
jgi:hypothetical protein